MGRRGKGRSRRGRGGGRGGHRRSPRALLRNALDKTLEGIHAELAVVGGAPQSEPVGLQLNFEEGVEVYFGLGHDGESIRISKKPIQHYPGDETEIEVMPEEQTESEQWMAFVGKKCEDVYEVRDMSFGGKGVWSGVEFKFEGGVVLSAYNWGDELLTTVPPEDFGAFERRSVRRKDDDGGRDGRGSRDGGRGSGRGGSGGSKDQKDQKDRGDKAESRGGGDSGGDPGGDGKPRKRRRRRRRRSRGDRSEEE